MSFTRRSLLRSATLASMASAFGTTPLLLSGCNEHRKFKYGVRIFFEGGWVFYADPFDPYLMRAVALNPPEFTVPAPPAPDTSVAPATSCPTPPPPSEPKHIFPYGIWDENGNWDHSHNCLPANKPSCEGSRLVPYPVSVAGTKDPACRVDDLFRTTDTLSRMTYIMNPGRKYVPNCGCTGLRVVSMPFPTRIVPAAFRTDATVCDPDNHLHQHGPCVDTGIATTHIFDYIGAHSLTFNLPAVGTHQADTITMAGGDDFHSDFHFHAVPAHMDQLPLGHDRMMFTKLISFINPDLAMDVTLSSPNCSTIKVAKGSLVPTSVTDDELEILAPPLQCKQYATAMQINLATCGSSGIAHGDGGS